MTLVLGCILGYIALQLGVVFVLSRQPRSEADYLLAGRRLGPMLTTFSVFATWFGAENCVGAAGEAYHGGWAAVLGDPFGYSIGLVLTGVLVAGALWRSGILTLADLFRQRYGAGVERLAAIIMIPGSVLWAAAQVRALGQVLGWAGELNVDVALAMAALVVVIYTAIGGMWADAWTDLVQGLVLIAGLAVMAVLFFARHGTAMLPMPVPQLPPEGLGSMAETLAVPVFSTIAAQELTARLLAARSPALARGATAAGGLLYLLVGLIPVLLGLGAVAVVGHDAEPEQLLTRLAHDELPLPLYILFLSALVSAILSTLSGALLVAGSLAAHNLIGHWRQAPLDEAAKLRWNRIAVALLGLVAWGFARSNETLYGLAREAAGLGSAGMLVLMLFALMPRRIGGAASAAAALLTSLAIYLLGEHVFDWPYPYLGSLATALLVYLLLAPLTRRRSPLPQYLIEQP